MNDYFEKSEEYCSFMKSLSVDDETEDENKTASDIEKNHEWDSQKQKESEEHNVENKRKNRADVQNNEKPEIDRFYPVRSSEQLRKKSGAVCLCLFHHDL